MCSSSAAITPSGSSTAPVAYRRPPPHDDVHSPRTAGCIDEQSRPTHEREQKWETRSPVPAAAGGGGTPGVMSRSKNPFSASAALWPRACTTLRTPAAAARTCGTHAAHGVRLASAGLDELQRAGVRPPVGSMNCTRGKLAACAAGSATAPTGGRVARGAGSVGALAGAPERQRGGCAVRDRGVHAGVSVTAVKLSQRRAEYEAGEEHAQSSPGRHWSEGAGGHPGERGSAELFASQPAGGGREIFSTRQVAAPLHMAEVRIDNQETYRVEPTIELGRRTL